jgi:dTDP-4-dehydrorhamnose 3,5-epimerase
MNVLPTQLPEVLLLEPKVHRDPRGFFYETFHSDRYAQLGISALAQSNLSRSVKGTLRGLHFQEPQGQGKLVQVVRGAIFDVAVDVRRASPTFRRYVSAELTEDNQRQLWIPPGFAHGFCVLSDVADVLYHCTALYVPEADRVIRWNDPEIGVSWPISEEPLLSPKDAGAPLLKDAPVLPTVNVS